MSSRKEGNKIKGEKREADWRLLIARPPVGAREKGEEGALLIARVGAKRYSIFDAGSEPGKERYIHVC